MNDFIYFLLNVKTKKEYSVKFFLMSNKNSETLFLTDNKYSQLSEYWSYTSWNLS